MKHAEIKESLYDFLTNRLKEESRQEVEKHLETCQDCQGELEELRGTISLLDEWTLPEISPDFEARVMERIEATVARPIGEGLVARLRSGLEIITDRIKIIRDEFLLPFKLPLGGLVVTAVVLLAVTIYYRGLTPEVPIIPRKAEVTLTKVENPIIIETNNVDNALERLKGLIQVHNGKLLPPILQVEGGKQVTFSLEKEEETSLFEDLKQLGKLKIEKEGYKDGQGNIVVKISTKNTKE